MILSAGDHEIAIVVLLSLTPGYKPLKRKHPPNEIF